MAAAGEEGHHHTTAVSLHVPGHKRARAPDATTPAHARALGARALRNDTTEIPGLDNLAAPAGVIARAQQLAAEAFGASRTWLCTNGSTGGVTAAVLAT